ncbi:mosc containing [Fusarium sporotrichioides]|uniref:Mosc containing n=1 Tax=Fusarium sporotrichioides TaxID=5514 RepID=A0A395SMY7_FUSSP|nr:mosc containing [Fusarium sporotrichioides]
MTIIPSSIHFGMDATKQFVSNLDAVSLTLLTVTLVAFLIPIFILFPPVTVDCSDVLRQTHSRAGEPLRDSNIHREPSPDHRARDSKRSGTEREQQHVFPVHLCRGIELRRDGTSSSSSECNHLYVFAHQDHDDDHVWKAATCERFPLLASIEVDLWAPDPNKTSRLLGKVEGSFLVLRFPWTDAGLQGILQRVSAKLSHGFNSIPEKEFMLPVSYPNEDEIRERGYQSAQVEKGNDKIMALNMDVELPTELARYLGVEKVGIFRLDHQ